MMEHLPALVIVVPLLSALVAGMLSWTRPGYCFPLALGALLVSAACALGLLFRAATQGPVEYFLGNWPPPVGIAYRVDTLAGLVVAAVTISALLNLWASRQQVAAEFQHKQGAFYTLYLLAVVGLVGIVVTGDAFNLYVLLEITSLTGYALVGMGQGRAPLAGLNYLIMGTIGACFYLLAIGYLYTATGTLNMLDLARLLPPMYHSSTVLIAFMLALVGLWVKMAFFPLHAWLPGAYSLAPSPAAGLLAPLMTKVMIYVMLRLMITVFTPAYVFGVVGLSGAVVWLATAAIVAGALLALSARDFRRMLTYIIIGEVGYMVGGAWLGNRLGMSGAILHIVNDAFMTLCLFLAAGALAQRVSDLRLENFRGLFAKMPFTMGALVVGALSIIGVPPTCGFFSKWYLILGGLEAGHYQFVAALIFSSLVSVVLFFRVFEHAFFHLDQSGHHEAAGGHGDGHAVVAMAEAPVGAVLPLALSAAILVGLGFLTRELVVRFVLPALPPGVM